MITFLDVDKFAKGLKPVKTTELITKSDEFNIEGLFSEAIFGPEGSLQRRKTYAYIDLSTKVIHPSALKILLTLEKKSITNFLKAEMNYILDDNGRLKESEDGVTGIPEFIKLFPKIKFRIDTPQREKKAELLTEAYEKGILFVDKLPVIPPELRPAFKDEEGNWSFDELNDMYINVMRRAFQVRGAGSGPLYDLLVYSLQEAVNDHDQYIRDKISKKRGLIRNQLLGKRVDFSGRAVITGGPNLKLNEIGVPFKMAVGLFEPFLLYQLLNSGRVSKEELSKEIKEYTDMELSTDSIGRVIRSIVSGDKMPERLYEIFWNATEAAMEGRVVIAKRDPVIQAESVRAYIPILIEGETIQLSTLQVGGHNADFDGDQMAIFHPLTNEAQKEAREKMMRLTSGNNSSAIVFEVSMEMAIGLYVLTKNKKGKSSPIHVTDEDLEKATDPTIPVVFKKKNTTMGKAIFNSCLPANYPFVDDLVTKKVCNKIFVDLTTKYTPEEISKAASKIKDYGFKFATIAAPSITLDDLEIPREILDLKKDLDKVPPEEASELIKKMEKILINHLEETGLKTIIDSGAGKGWDQPMQILVAKGIISGASGQIIVVKGSFSEGLSNTEYFNASYGARKGIVDRVINTADTGYMSRKLAFLLNSVEASPTLRDCGTKMTLEMKLTSDIIGRLTGRFIVNKSGKIEEFDKTKVKSGDTIQLRSPIFCISPKICHTCYGKLLARLRSPFIGVAAAQIIGERGTQLIMKCSDGLVHYDNKLIPFVDLWDILQEDSVEDCKNIDIIVDGREGATKASSIQRHLPSDDVLFISTKTGHTLICQANHPLFVKKNKIHEKFDNRKCRLIGENTYTEIQSTRKPFTTDDELAEIEAGNLRIYDAIWIDNEKVESNNGNIEPEMNAYFCGIYCAEGNKIWSDRKTKGNYISQRDSKIKERIIQESDDYIKFTVADKGIFYWDNDQRINKIVLGDYAWEKRLNIDFINYKREWLNDFLCGLIDGDGTVFTDSSTCARIYTSSYYLVQQLKTICIKLGYKMNSCLVSRVNPSDFEDRRPHFSCDIRFPFYTEMNSEKIKENGSLVTTKIRNERVTKGFDIITNIKKIDNWNYPLYDIKTETNEYMLGCVHNHNSFHTGGAVSIVKKDMIEEMSLNESDLPKAKINQYISQDNETLVCKKPCKITLDLIDDYDTSDNMIIDQHTIWVRSLVATIEFEDLMFTMILDYDVTFNIQMMNKVGKDRIELKYTTGSTILETPVEVSEIKKQMHLLERILGGREPYKDVQHLFKKVYNIYAGKSDMDLVHIEVLISNTLRYKQDVQLPARLGKTWDPTMVNIKKVVFSSGFVQGLAFENVNEAITSGLIAEKELEPSVLEKVMTGELVKPIDEDY